MNGTPTDNPSPPGDASAITRSEPFFQRTDWLSFIATTAFILVVYLFTLCPEVDLLFSGVFATAAWHGGVPHPPGFPLWTLYAQLFTILLPFSNIAWRVSVSSAVAGSLACGLVALMVSRGIPLMLDRFAAFGAMPAKSQKQTRIVCGFVAGCGLAFDGCFWRNCVTIETYALGLLLLAVTLCLLLRWGHNTDQKRYLYAAFFVYGLTLTVDLYLAIVALGLLFLTAFIKPAFGRDLSIFVSIIFGGALLAHFFSFLPSDITDATQMHALRGTYWVVALITAVVAIASIAVTCRFLTEWQSVCVSVFLLFLALSVYFYLPIASMTNPPMNWGYPRTVEGFIHDLARGQYEKIRPSENLSIWVSQFGQYLKQTLTEFGWPYSATALVPLCFMFKLRARGLGWMLGLLGCFVCLGPWIVAMLNPPPDRAASDLIKDYFAASHLILSIWSGYGLAIVAALLSRRTRS